MIQNHRFYDNYCHICRTVDFIVSLFFVNYGCWARYFNTERVLLIAKTSHFQVRDSLKLLGAPITWLQRCLSGIMGRK